MLKQQLEAYENPLHSDNTEPVTDKIFGNTYVKLWISIDWDDDKDIFTMLMVSINLYYVNHTFFNTS